MMALTLSAAPKPVAHARAVSSAFESSVQPFLRKNCYGCHNAKLLSGGLDIQSYKSAAAVGEDPEHWDKILQRLASGDMPPKPLPRPKDEEVQVVTGWIQAEMDRVDRLRKPEAGRVTARRLNRAEYNNTVRDLLGLDLDVANDFPQDNSAYGFDNISDALSLSPLLMEKYMAAAEKIARYAVIGPEIRKPLTVRFTPTLPRRMEGNPVKLEVPPFYTLTDYDTTGRSHPGAFHGRHRFPATGEYLLRFVPNGTRPAGSEPQDLNIWVDGMLAHTFQVRELRTETNEVVPVPHEVRLKLTAGYHDLAAAYPRLFEGLPPAFNGLNPSKLPQPPPPNPARFLQPLPKDATPKQVADREAAIVRIRERVRKPVFEGLAVGLVEIVGPYDFAPGPLPIAVSKIFTCGHPPGAHQPACERRIVTSLATRAFRRPATPEEVSGLLQVAAVAGGRSFEQGIALALQAMLVSPDFLFRIEKRAPVSASGAPVPIGQYELASRLSYFLWSSMPDQELMGAAGKGTLRRPEVLTAQVRRMLKDPKSEALVSNFVGQWLETRRLEGVQPDRDRFPDFDDHLRESMTRETELFFRNLLQQDGSILDLLNGNYTFVNERLARHYGIKDVNGPEFRRVSLAGTGRAGILTQASVLTVSSYNNRTSPVLRGKWILENFFNSPPPPPPPNVPALDEAAVGATVSLRQQLEQHRANAVCASCHSRMDPLGFALENYNAVGVWRTHDGKFPIDPSGTLPNGKALQGPADLNGILAGDRDTFTRCLTEKLLMYATGRGVERFDGTTVRNIAKDVAVKQYRLSSLIMDVVKSVPFQMQSAERGKS